MCRRFHSSTPGRCGWASSSSICKRRRLYKRRIQNLSPTERFSPSFAFISQIKFYLREWPECLGCLQTVLPLFSAWCSSWKCRTTARSDSPFPNLLLPNSIELNSYSPSYGERSSDSLKNASSLELNCAVASRHSSTMLTYQKPDLNSI